MMKLGRLRSLHIAHALDQPGVNLRVFLQDEFSGLRGFFGSRWTENTGDVHIGTDEVGGTEGDTETFQFGNQMAGVDVGVT